MKRLQILSMIVLVIGLICFLMWRFVFSVPDGVVRATGIILLVSVFALVFSSMRLYSNKKQIKNGD